MLAARFAFLLSLELLAEYRAVLLRGAIQSRHGLSEPEVDVILTEIAANATLRSIEEIEAPSLSTDPGDLHVVRLLATHESSVLVSGDRRLEQSLRGFRPVYKPAGFVELISQAGSA